MLANPSNTFVLLALPDRPTALWFDKLWEDPNFQLIGYYPVGSQILQNCHDSSESGSLYEGLMIVSHSVSMAGTPTLQSPKDSGSWPPTYPPTIPPPFPGPVTESEPRTTGYPIELLKLNPNLTEEQKTRVQTLLKRHESCFAWDSKKLGNC